MPENTNNTQAAGQQQRIGWGAAVEPVDAETLERLAATGDGAHVRSMARELLLHRKDEVQRQRAANTGRQLDRLNLTPEALKAMDAISEQQHWTSNDAFAIKMVADMIRELGEYREGKRRDPSLQPLKLTASNGNVHTLWGVASDIDYLTHLMNELGEWRTGGRQLGTTISIKRKRELEQLDGLREVLTGLGWTPPQS